MGIKFVHALGVHCVCVCFPSVCLCHLFLEAPSLIIAASQISSCIIQLSANV